MEQNAFVAFQSANPNHALNVSATVDGIQWQMPPHDYGTGIQLGSSPCYCVFNGKMYVAFQANDDTRALYVTSSVDGVSWVTPAIGYAVALGSAPAMAAFNGRLYLAYKSTDSHHELCLMCTSDGLHWSDPVSYSGIQIGSAPAIATFNRKLYIAFQANDSGHALYVTSSSDGANWVTPAKGYSIALGSAPAVVAFNGKLYLAYRADDSSQKLYVTSSDDGTSWGGQTGYDGIQLGSAPTLTAFNGMIYLAFQANDTGKSLYITSSPDGVNWKSPATEYPQTYVGSAPALCDAPYNYVLSGGMIVHVDPNQHPTPPAGCTAVSYTGPDATTVSSSYPIITCNGNTYWAYDPTDGRNAMNIVMYDYNGSVVKQWSMTGAKNLWAITTDPHAQTVSFVGQDNSSITMSWADLLLTSYKLTADDLSYVAQYYGYTLSTNDATTLANSLPVLDCATCCAGNPGYLLDSGRRLSVGYEWAVGQAVGAIACGAAGFLIGGPAGGVAGFAIGLSIGSNIGLITSITANAYSYTASKAEADSTYFTITNFAAGPFSNGSAFEDVFRYNFPRYGQAPQAAALGFAGSGNQALGWYPAGGSNQLQPLKSSYAPLTTSNGSVVYKYIFAIVEITDASGANLPNTFQIRLNSEDFFPDTIVGRINHSQLTEGSVFAALMGLATMLNYGAGSLYVSNSQIVGLDTRSGHYYWSFKGRDDLVLQNAIAALKALHYDTSEILMGQALNQYLLDNY